MTSQNRDGWFARRMMRMTRLEKQAVNSRHHARQTVQTALALLEHLTLPPQPHCMEVGCGQGALTRLLVERYDAQVIASDFDPAQVALAQESLADLGERVDVRIVDARAMPFEAAQFDAVFSFGVLHHVPGKWRQIVAEVARVLKPGGYLVFTDFILASRAAHLIERLFPRLDQVAEASLHACLSDKALALEHYEYGHSIAMGLMRYSMAVAHKAG